eukprot:410929_1
MDTEEAEEDDDPTSLLSTNERKECDGEATIISDDILFLCFEWLFPSSLSKCAAVSKHWDEAAKDNHLWKLHCVMAFARVSSKNLANKYSNSYYKYYQKHKKLRFDGVYVLKVLYYIQSESALPDSNNTNPYTAIEYYRYLRFFNNQCDGHKKIKNDQSFDALYALSKRKPSEYSLFAVFGSHHCAHENMRKDNKLIVASFHSKTDGITKHEKVFSAKYDISSKKIVILTCKTDYGLALELGLSYDEVTEGASDRLNMVYFDGMSLNSNGDRIDSTRDHYEIRHE